MAPYSILIQLEHLYQMGIRTSKTRTLDLFSTRDFPCNHAGGLTNLDHDCYTMFISDIQWSINSIRQPRPRPSDRPSDHSFIFHRITPMLSLRSPCPMSGATHKETISSRLSICYSIKVFTEVRSFWGMLLLNMHAPVLIHPWTLAAFQVPGTPKRV